MPTTTETTNVRKQGPITLIGDFWFGDRVALIDAEGATIRKGYVPAWIGLAVLCIAWAGVSLCGFAKSLDRRQ